MPGRMIRLTLSSFVSFVHSTIDPAIVTYDWRKNDQTPVVLEYSEYNNELVVTWRNETPPNRVRLMHFSHEFVLNKGGPPPQPIEELMVGFTKSIGGIP